MLVGGLVNSLLGHDSWVDTYLDDTSLGRRDGAGSHGLDPAMIWHEVTITHPYCSIAHTCSPLFLVVTTVNNP